MQRVAKALHALRQSWTGHVRAGESVHAAGEGAESFDQRCNQRASEISPEEREFRHQVSCPGEGLLWNNVHIGPALKALIKEYQDFCCFHPGRLHDCKELPRRVMDHFCRSLRVRLL